MNYLETLSKAGLSGWLPFTSAWAGFECPMSPDKVTPSSKVVGDMAQFMVHNNLTKDDVINQASDLSFPNSVIDMMQGGLGWPEGGFPEPLRTQIVGDRDTVVGRPGENLDDVNFLQIQRDLNKAGFQA